MLTLYFSVFVFNLIAILMKKRLRAFEYYGSIYFGIFWANVVDRFTDKYHMYYFFENINFISFRTLWVLLGIYPAATMIIINWYPFNKTWFKKILYILAWSVFSTFYEWLSLKSGFLHYQNWKLWHSALLYPFLYSGLMLNLYFIRWLYKKPYT
jgi:hypothetical protein